VGKIILLGFHLFLCIQISKVIPMHTNNTSCFKLHNFFLHASCKMLQCNCAKVII
jgi:hypothetical protein